MPESMVGHAIEKLGEKQQQGPFHQSRLEVMEIIEAVILALIVTDATLNLRGESAHEFGTSGCEAEGQARGAANA